MVSPPVGGTARGSPNRWNQTLPQPLSGRPTRRPPASQKGCYTTPTQVETSSSQQETDSTTPPDRNPEPTSLEEDSTCHPHSTEGSCERRSQGQLDEENDCKKRRVDTANSETVGNSTASADGTPADHPAKASDTAESRPPSCRPAGPKRVASAPGVFAPEPTQSANGVPWDALSGLDGADATPVSPKEHGNCEEWSEEDSCDESPVAELSIDPEWESCFANFLIAKRRRTSVGDAQATGSREATNDSDDYDSSLPTEELETLLELMDVGIPVSWPQGLDARVARIVLSRRAALQNGSSETRHGAT